MRRVSGVAGSWQCGRAAAAVMIAALLGGCTQTLQGKPDRLYSVQEETDAARSILKDLTVKYDAAATDNDRAFYRNEIIGRRMYAIDFQYSEYEAALTRERQELGFGAGTVAQGLSTAGALTTAGQTTRVLSGLAAAVGAVKGLYDSEIIIAKTLQIAQAQMRAQRDIVAARILKRRTESTLTYPLSFALTDLEDYYRAGTLTAGLIKASGEAGEAAAAAEDHKGIIIQNATVPIQRPAQSPLVIDDVRLGLYEQRLIAGDIKRLQNLVCATEDGKFTKATRDAVLAHLEKIKKKDTAFKDRITDKDGSRLRTEIRAGRRACSS